ncbi:MAG: alpha/beta hydrolase [Woeseiaceae bacterium]
MPPKRKVRRGLPLISIGVIGITQAGIAPAQDASTYYTVMHPDEFEIDWRSFYRQAEQKTSALRAKLPHHLDLAYGEDPKQRLDLYLPAGDAADAPVFLFLHGGGFQEGDRAQYGFIAEPFAEHGIVTAVASYRLTVGGHTYPAQPEDVRHAVEWLYHHVAEYGGDPAAIYVGGHSAGAILAADIGVDRTWLEEAGIPRETLRGIVPISGAYDLRKSSRAYVPTPEAEAAASPMLHIADPAPAAVVAVGSVEETYLGSSREFAGKLSAMGVSTKLLIAEGEDHRGTVASLADGDSDLFRMTLEMIRK